MTPQQANRAISMLKSFKKSHQDLIRLWIELVALDEDDKISNILNSDFPFEKSIDEYNVNKWCDNAIEKLRQISNPASEIRQALNICGTVVEFNIQDDLGADEDCESMEIFGTVIKSPEYRSDVLWDEEIVSLQDNHMNFYDVPVNKIIRIVR